MSSEKRGRDLDLTIEEVVDDVLVEFLLLVILEGSALGKPLRTEAVKREEREVSYDRKKERGGKRRTLELKPLSHPPSRSSSTDGSRS